MTHRPDFNRPHARLFTFAFRVCRSFSLVGCLEFGQIFFRFFLEIFQATFTAKFDRGALPNMDIGFTHAVQLVFVLHNTGLQWIAILP